MKQTYPIVITKSDDMFVVDIPDFDAGTQGYSLVEAMEMARDAIGMLGIDLEDDQTALPDPCNVSSIKAKKNQIVTLVDVDFAEYRRRNDTRKVKKNCTIPYWLCKEAEQSGINFSQVLTTALEAALCK